MNVLSLFDGMSCGRLALQRAGLEITNYFASEIDPAAIQIAQKNFPDTIQLGDVTKWREWDLPKIDLIIGGSPCQGFSFAGKQLNFDDPRSKLFFEFEKAVKELKPTYFLLENVNMSKKSLNVISNVMGVEPIKINSELVSAQLRNRLYWTNIEGVGIPANKCIVLSDVLESGYVDREKAFCIDANYFKGGNLKSYFEKSRRQLVFLEPDKFDKYRKLSPVECERLQTLPDNYTAGVSNTQRYRMIGNGWTVDVITHILSKIPVGVGAK